MMFSLAGIISRPEIHYIDVSAFEDGFALLTSDRRVEFVDSDAGKVSEYSLGSDDMPVAIDVIDGFLAVAYKDRIVALIQGQEVTVPMPEGLDIIDLDVYSDRCYALTDSSRIVSFDMDFNPSIFDFNANYSKYYGEVRLSAIAVSDDALCVCGVRLSDGAPVAFLSSHGNVWSQRDLTYSRDGSVYLLDNEPVSATYSPSRQAFVLGCIGGVLFTIPGCSHCNYPEYTRSGDVNGIAFNGESYLAVGTEVY